MSFAPRASCSCLEAGGHLLLEAQLRGPTLEEQTSLVEAPADWKQLRHSKWKKLHAFLMLVAPNFFVLLF